MTVSPEGVLLVARRRTHEVVALPDKNKDGVAEPEVILTGQTNAHSLAFHGGYLYIATTPAVMRVRWTNGAPDGTPRCSPSCRARRPRSTPRERLASVLTDVCTSRSVRRAMSALKPIHAAPRSRCTTPTGRRVPFATGLRNANGFDWDPATGRLWAGDNGQDGLGPDFPPDEINLVEAGRHYGFPFFIGRNRPNPTPVSESVPPRSR